MERVSRHSIMERQAEEDPTENEERHTGIYRSKSRSAWCPRGKGCKARAMAPNTVMGPGVGVGDRWVKAIAEAGDRGECWEATGAKEKEVSIKVNSPLDAQDVTNLTEATQETSRRSQGSQP